MNKLFFFLIVMSGISRGNAQVERNVNFDKREISAPAPIRAKLQQVRANIKLRNLGYTVRVTDVFDKHYRTITGALNDNVTPQEASRQNIIDEAKMKQSGLVFQKSILELTGYKSS